MSHSKRNTSRAVFTSYERSQAKAAWGASSARLSRESFLPFASCSLCLEAAVEPVACPRGDIFCRECALSNILAQKKEIKRADRARRDAEKEAAEADRLGEQESHERAVREFELVQAGFDVAAPAGAKTSGAAAASSSSSLQATAAGRSGTAQTAPRALLESGQQDGAGGSSSSSSAKKRAFELDEEELARIAAEDRAKARRTIDSEKAAKPTLPSFWAPTVTPTSNQHNVLHEVKKAIKKEPVCPSSKEGSPHPLSLHSLTTINFTEDGPAAAAEGGAAKRQRICPACRKELSNSSRAVLAKPCGHVLCKSCVAQFMTPSDKIDPHAPEADPNQVRCFVCDADVTERKHQPSPDKHKKDKIAPGLVELRSEGTGFSAGGTNQVKKSGVAFQC